MTNYPAPSPRYIGPPDKFSAGDNKPIKRIVIHSTVSPCRPGQAEATARYFMSSSAGGSAHYAVDPSTVIQCAYDSVICWHAPPNPHSLGIEMTEYPSLRPGRWRKPEQRAMLKRTASLTAALCLAYDVPAEFLTVRRLKAGRKGITTHNNVSRAFGQSTHWDPGFWPRRRFMRLVRASIRERRRKSS